MGAHPLVPAAPSARRVAREFGVDIGAVPGSGPGGRISADDVRQYARAVLGAGEARTRGVVAPPLPDFAKWGGIERKPMSQVRRKTAEHMAQAWANVCQVTQFDQADVTHLEEIRRQYSERVEKSGGKLTVTAIALKVAAAALKVFPQFAASVDMARGEIIYKKYCHIGVAVDTERGLLVPVIQRRGQEEYPPAFYRTLPGCRKSPQQETDFGRDGRRSFYHHQPGRDWRHVFFANCQLPGGGYSWHFLVQAGAGLHSRTI